MTQTARSPAEPIAIVGSGCRFPGGASSPSALWKLLEKPRDLRREITPDRFSTTGFYHHDGARHGTTNVRHSYLLDEDVRVFDSSFFNISPSEADAIDPQQRLLLETVYEALEAGGHPLEAMRGSDTAVYVGTMTVDYHDTLVRDHNTIPKYFATGINRAIISNRVSYFFDWHGPSMTIDTACSSSLIAVHQGVQALRNGESRVAVACGTQVLLGYDMYIGESKLKMLSPNGRSRMWDADADGYARGEGVAAVVLKRLSDALADGDHIECVIRETGANQDGFSNGLTVPSTEAQTALIRRTYAKAGLDPETNPDDRPQYFEAHGTGTQAGDPREAAAIHQALGQHFHAAGGSPLYVGSIKTIIGHLEGAAGLAGLLKASLSLQRGFIPPNLSFSRLNPKIEPFYKGLQVPTSLTPWPVLTDGVPRRASVNSFGFGGANAHAILEEYKPPVSGAGVEDKTSTSFAPFVFSALSETSLVALLQQYSQVLKTRGDIDPADLAWTLHSRKSQLPTRVAFSARTVQQLSDKIDNKLVAAKAKAGTAIGIRPSGKPATPCVLGVFTGQGAQWPAMGAQLVRSSPFVRKRIEELEESLATLPPADRPTWSLVQEILAGEGTSRIAEAALSQPLCTAIQVVLVDLLRTAGITFSAVVGHSSGEIAAAYAAGFLSARDAIRVAYYRGLYAKLAGNTANGQKGAMMAVGASWDEAHELVNQPRFRGRLAIAAHNSSASVTLSGDADAVAEAKTLLDAQKKFARALKVDTAYHSHHMLPCGDPYITALRACGVRVNRDRHGENGAAVAWFSSVTASEKPMEPVEELQDVYWRENMTGTVRFANAVKNAVASHESLNLALEIGPHPALKGPATQNIADVRPTPLPYSGVLNRGNDDVDAFSDALGFIWAQLGAKAVDLQSFEKAVSGDLGRRRLVVDLPTYQWDHGRVYWSEGRRSRRVRARKNAPHELLGVLSPESNGHDMRWSNILKVSEIPWIESHQLQGVPVFPAAGYVAMAIEACRIVAAGNNKAVELFELHNLSIPRAITFEEGDTSSVETLATLTAITSHDDQTVTADFAIYFAPNATASPETDMELAASGTVKMILGNPDLAALPPSAAAAEDYNLTSVDPDRVYSMFSKLGYGYTGPFRGLSSTKRRLNHATAMVDTYAYADDDATLYLVHPATLDVAIQSSMLAYSSPGDGRLWSLHVPTEIRTIRVNPEACAALPTTRCRVPISTTLNADEDVFSANIEIRTEDGRHGMVQVEELVLKPFAPATEAEDRWMYSATQLDVAFPDLAVLGGYEGVDEEEELGLERCYKLLAGILKQLTHRYPRARILELGAATGEATKSILEAISSHGGVLPSYTYTDVSEDAIKHAANVFSTHRDLMTFKILDLEQAPATQGYEPHSYDIVVVASNALHATASLDKALEHTRQLIKPGGYLVLLEPSDNAPSDLPSSWLGIRNNGAKHVPTGPPRTWHLALRKAGFSGIDAINPASTPFSVMVTQAVDAQILFLRRPLSSPLPSSFPVSIPHLVILGTGTLETCRIAEELSDILGRFSGAITVLNGLPTEADPAALALGSTFVNLVDLDALLFENVTEDTLEGLKRVFEAARHVLWITRGAAAGTEPYHAASVAFCRALANEAAHVSFGVLDISPRVDIRNSNNSGGCDVSRVIAEQLLRQCALEEWGEQERLLWSREPEAMLQHDGRLLIPRIVPDREMNARLNATRRVITKAVAVEAGINFAVDADVGGVSSLSVVEDGMPASKTGDLSVVRTVSSSLMALRVGSDDAFLFLSVGRDAGGRPVVALSTTNSLYTAPVVSMHVADVGHEVVINADCLLVAVMSELLAAALVQGLAPGSSILVHCSDKDRFLATALAYHAMAKKVRVVFTCREDAKMQDKAWIKLSARTPGHVVRRLLLPVRATHFLDLTASDPRSLSEVGKSIARALPSDCRRISLSSLFQAQAFLPRSFDRAVLLKYLYDAFKSCSLAATTSTQEGDAQDLAVQLNQPDARPSTPHSATSVIRWPADGEQVRVEVRPIDGRRLFSRDKTYLLFGLAGQIGQSLCEWMAANGAGCVCLISRNPKVDQHWLESFEGTNTTVKVLAGDITNKDSLGGLLKTIRETCPPIAGVANGANVLSDAPFNSMSTSLFNRALSPKINGSYNLDLAFYNEPLDFFVLFSSVSSVFGTAGQSNYVAANGYLNGLARQRRRRGLAASTIDVGLVLGIGVAEAAGQSVIDSLQKYGITPLSEPDVRLAFAEAIRAGYPRAAEREEQERGPAAVMTSGLRTIAADETDIVWYNNPIFSHLVIDTKGPDGTADQGKSKAAALPVKERLARAANKEEACQVLRESFSAKLRAVLQSAAGQAIPNDTPLVELGVDSLVAVEVRSWFLKMLKVDLPVLKLVGGSTLNEICELVMKKLPEDIFAQTGVPEAPAAVGASTSATAPPGVVEVPPGPVESRPPPPQPQPSSLQSTTITSAGAFSSASDDENASTSGAQTPQTIDTPASSVMQASLTLSSRQKDGDLTAKSSAATDTRSFVKSELISLGQSRFWFLRLLVDDPTTFNVALKFRLNGTVRVGDLERALGVVTARHEALRTSFIGDEEGEADQAYQKILARSTVKLERKSISSEEEAAAEYNKLRAHKFDLATGPLLRLVLLTLSPTSHYLLVNYHHIIMDMASFQVLTSELDRVYNSKPLDEPPTQYPDFSVAQRRALDSGELNGELEYWKKVFPLSEQAPVLPLLPMARLSSRTAMTNYAVHQVSTRLAPDLAAHIKVLSKTKRCTPFHFFLAAFKAMLFAFTDAQDLTIGIADANRRDGDVMGSIGFFLNLLTLRFRRHPRQRFNDAMVEARDTAYAALEHSRLPFNVLLKELNVARSSSWSPLFQAFFDYRQQTSDKQTFCNCQFDLEEMHPGRSAYDISLDVADLGRSEDVHVTFRVQKGLYNLTAANLLLETYGHFVHVLAHDVDLVLEDTPLFSEKQLARGLQVGLGPDMVLPDWPATLPHRIDHIALENADKIALMDGLGNRYTYAALIKRVEAIAEALLEKGVGSGSRVLVFQQAAADWVCSMLAIMRVGGVYVPLDLRNPLTRLAAQAEHCQPKAVVADDTTINDAPQLYAAATIVNVSHVPAAPLASARIANVAHPDQPAAVLYTSGSTGTPKGIMIKHSGIRNEMEGYTKTYGLMAERVLQQSAFTFDFSVDQIFTGLVNGGTVYVVPYSKRGDPISITEIMRTQAITYTKVTPSEYSMWMQYGGDNLRQASSWRFAFAGGEPLTKTVLRQFADLGLAPQLRLFNSYGPAEISIASHKGLIDYVKESRERPPEEEEPVPCGYSLPNYATYVLDENLKPLPVGMPGEVVIGGPGVSFGYLANVELTSRVFVENPYATPAQKANGWTRMHRTGDIGHLREDGALVFRHRIAGDTQVKLRGLRIDLRDIEANILSTAGGMLREAIVTLRAGDPDYLVAHVVFAPEHQHAVGDKDNFLERLLRRLPLPQYMVPVLAVPLDKLPVNNHHKVDRKSLKAMPLPQRSTPTTDDDAAGLDENNDSDAITHQLRQVWREILPDSAKLGLAITRTTSFFSIGGNSLLVVRLQSCIKSAFGVAVRLVDLLNANTLREMARVIEQSPRVEGAIDWERETEPPALPRFLADLPPKNLNHTTDTEKIILVTGATGYLARHVLPLLLADPRVSKIHCVTVRDRPRDQSLPSSDKIVSHVGDLTLPLLGLPINEFRYLAEHVDAVLHLGAARAFWDTYQMLRGSNVHATRELVKLAGARRIPVHFVSTAGVLDYADTKQPPTDGSDGYVATKWASERLLERSAEMVPGVLYRLLPCPSASSSFDTTTNTNATAEQQTLKKQVLEDFSRCVRLAGNILPDTSNWQGRMDLIQAERVARWLCESVLDSTSTASEDTAVTQIRVMQLESPVSVDVDELREYLEMESQTNEGEQESKERMPLLKWMGRIKAAGFGWVLGAQDATLGGPGGQSGKLRSRR